MLKKQRAGTGTTHADIKLGYSCNNDCLHCPIVDLREEALKTRGTQDRTTVEYKKELWSAKGSGCKSVTFTGGEPTIRDDLLELIEHAASLGFEIFMQTNVRGLLQRSLAAALAPFSILYTVSIHGPDAPVHDAITRRVGSFQETVQGIKNLAALHQSCNCRIVISKSNIALLGEILAFLVGIGIKNIDFTFPHIQGNARRYGDAVVPMYSEIQPLLKRVFHLGRKHSVRTSFSGIPVCFMYGFEDCASAYYRSKAGKKELRQLDGKVLDMAVLKNSMYCKHAKCLDCPYETICPGVRREYIELFGASEFR